MQITVMPIQQNRTPNIDADYGFYDIRNQVQPNYYYDSTGTVIAKPARL